MNKCERKAMRAGVCYYLTRIVALLIVMLCIFLFFRLLHSDSQDHWDTVKDKYIDIFYSIVYELKAVHLDEGRYNILLLNKIIIEDTDNACYYLEIRDNIYRQRMHARDPRRIEDMEEYIDSFYDNIYLSTQARETLFGCKKENVTNVALGYSDGADYIEWWDCFPAIRNEQDSRSVARYIATGNIVYLPLKTVERPIGYSEYREIEANGAFIAMFGNENEYKNSLDVWTPTGIPSVPVVLRPDGKKDGVIAYYNTLENNVGVFVCLD